MSQSTKPAEGTYLALYADGIEDPSSRCGYSDSELADIRAELHTRGLALVADDMGLLVVLEAARENLEEVAE